MVRGGLPGHRLFGERKLRRAGRDLPEVALRVGEVAAVAAPGRGLGGLDDRAAGLLGLGQDLVHTLLRADVVGQRDAAEAVAFGAHPGVLGELVPRVERDGGRAYAEQDAEPDVDLRVVRTGE